MDKTLKKPRITERRMAGPDHAVQTLEGGRGDLYRRTPCPGCPWLVANTGDFPPQAFVHSAPTSYDVATTSFACHESGTKQPATCAGFLLRSPHNLGLRIKVSRGQIDLDAVSDGGEELFEDYREMAIANGVDPSDPALERCR